MKKVLFFILFYLFLWFWFTSTLSVSPNDWSIWQNCVEEFDININSFWELIFGADIEINTSMEYVNFIPNKKLFEYYLPPRIDNGIIVLWAFSMTWKEFNSEMISFWKLYLKNISNNIDSFIKFNFKEVWSTTDTNLSAGSFDTLDSVFNWIYMLDWEVCPSNESVGWWIDAVDYEKQIKELTADLKKDWENKTIKTLFMNNIYIVVWLSILVILFLSFLVKKYKWVKVN